VLLTYADVTAASGRNGYLACRGCDAPLHQAGR